MVRAEMEEPMAAPGLPGQWGDKGRRTGHDSGLHPPTCHPHGDRRMLPGPTSYSFSRRAN